MWQDAKDLLSKIREKTNAMVKQNRRKLLVLFAVVVLVLGVVIVSYIKKENANDRQMDELREMHEVTPTLESIPKPEPTLSPEPTSTPILDKFTELYQTNEDIVGWLTIDKTDIDYPVMQCMEDRDYYLDKNFDKKKDQNGMLFVDTRCDVFMPSTNIIIYGHNMKSGKMFGNLELYESQDYYKEHKYITFNTLYEKRRYEVAAVFKSQIYKKNDDVFKYYQFYQADKKSEFDNFANNIQELSLYETDTEIIFGDAFITLSTCAYHTERGTFVVVAKRIE